MESIEAANNLLAVPLTTGGPPVSGLTAAGSPGSSGDSPTLSQIDRKAADGQDQIARTAALDAVFTAIAAAADAGRLHGLLSTSSTAENGTERPAEPEWPAQASSNPAAPSLVPGEASPSQADGVSQIPDRKRPPAPPNQGADTSNNTAAAASGGVANLGTSTGAGSQGGGGGGGGGGSSPVGGPLATLANEGAFGPAVVHAPAAPAAPLVQQAMLSPPPGGPPPPPPPVSQLSGSGTTISATEGALTNSYYWNSSVGDNLLVKGTAGVALSNVTVATFGDNNPLSAPGDFTATIDWGDNTTSAGTISALQGGGFAVAGSHTYAVAGNYNVTVSIAEASSGMTTATASTVAVIQDTPITATPVNVSATENTALNNVTVATFTDADASEPAADLSATIDWGDGSGTSTGTITVSKGNFTVTASHTYTEGGTFQPIITIASQGGSSAAVRATATVTDLPLTGTQLTLTPAVTGASTTLAASFADANTSEAPNNYMAQIDWGDGSPADDASVSGSNGGYSLNGSHVYDHPGNYTVTVTVTDAGGATLTQTGNVTISAASLSAAGATLSATAGQALTSAQIATFTDGNPDQMNDWFGQASGYTVAIDWGDGSGLDSGATIDGDPSGFYVLGTHTYANPGAYTATITITNADGATTTTTSTVDVTTIAPAGATLAASENAAANNVTVATFTDTQPGTYTASIDWGDGSTPTTGTVTGSGGSYTVTGSHTYAHGGTYPVTVTITNAQGLIAVAGATANVSDAPLQATPQSLTVPQNSPLNNVTLATFTDANPNDSVGSYSASIDWGDGSPTDEGTISLVNGVYTVTDSHTYTSQGSFNVGVSIGDDGGATTTANSTVTVGAPVISASAVSLSAQEGVALNNATVATFTAPGSADDYTATIDWGDGTTGSGTVTGSGGSFTVTGSHTYAQPTDGQQYLVTVTITDSAGDTATALSSATVDGGSVTVSAANPTVAEQSPMMMTLANFTETDPSYSADEFTALVDWGDGQQSFVTVTGSNGNYSVLGSHAYAEEGTYTVTIYVTDPNGVAIPALTEALTVTDAPLSASSVPVYATQGVALQDVEVATFTDQDTYAPASNYTATINWGDGSSSAGTVSGADGGFSVSGNHTYATAGDFTIQVTITDAGGSQATASGWVSVSGAANYFVGSFGDSNSGDTAGQFQATIDWGDGSPTSSGTVIGQAGAFYVNGMHAYAEDGSYAVTVTVAGPGGPLVLNSTAQVAEAALLGSQSPLQPPQAPPPASAIPRISFNFSPEGIYGDIFNAVAATQPGLRIHIDDDFFNGYEDDITKVLADNLINWISQKDTNLVSGTLNVGPGGSQGTLVWKIPTSLRVWWQPNPFGPWQVVKSGALPTVNFLSRGIPIPILLQGMSPDAGDNAKVTVSYTLQGQGAPATTSFFYNVYTGLSLTGDAAPRQTFIQQLEAASPYNFTVDGSGKVWRTSLKFLPQPEAYQKTFGDPWLTTILQNSDYAKYKTEVPTTIITAVATPNHIPWSPDKYELESIYPDNIAAISSDLGKADGPKFAAAMIVHVLQEQFLKQTQPGTKFKDDPTGYPDHAVGGAFGAGVTAEEAVLNWGYRVARDLGNPVKGVQISFIDEKNKKAAIVTIKWDPVTLKYLPPATIQWVGEK